MKLSSKGGEDKIGVKGKPAAGIATQYKRLQAGWAKWMARQTAGISPKRWPVLLFFFVLCTGGCSLFLVVKSLLGKGEAILLITPIQKPSIIHTDKAKKDSGIIADLPYKRIRQFRLFMDSLSNSPEGKKMHDSILYSRPGLMDSVRVIENFHQSQLKK